MAYRVAVGCCLVLVTACLGGGSSTKGSQSSAQQSPPAQGAEDQGWVEDGEVGGMTPNEMHMVLEPCGSKIGGSGRVVLQVKLDENGNPLAARAVKAGGFVSTGFIDCAEFEMMRNVYKSRGEPTTIGTAVDM